MRLLTLSVVLTIGATYAAPRAQAQEQAKPKQIRAGFWFSGGLGYGSLGCDNCSSRTGGASGGIALGGTLSRNIQIGVGTAGWVRSENSATLSVGTLDFRVRAYPSANSGFFLTGGIGVGTISASVGAFGAAETGVGVVAGLGYDIPLSPSVSLSPFVNGFTVRSANANANVGQAGLAITVH